MSSVHPEPPNLHSQPAVYEIVVSEQLPCFDATIFVKQMLMGREASRKLGRMGLRHRNVITLAYLVGLALRIIDMLPPMTVGEGLAMVSVVFQFPMVFLGIMAFRYEYVKVLMRTFEFYFLTLDATLWVVCAFIYLQDLRAILLPVVWVDFINLVLAETFFGESKTIFVVATTSGLYLVLFTAKVSLTLSQSEITQATSSEISSLTVKDALANAMGTMVTLMIRLAYRKRLPMRFIKIPALFDSQNTVYPAVANYNLKRWQVIMLYGCGVLGYTLSTLVLAIARSGEDTVIAGAAVPGAAILGLSLTGVFRLYFLSCCQR
ncbi:hypothetical protein Gpo141_00014394, partial [Globisporangium polare]